MSPDAHHPLAELLQARLAPLWAQVGHLQADLRCITARRAFARTRTAASHLALRVRTATTRPHARLH